MLIKMGNTETYINTSYVDSKTEEQDRIDKANVVEAIWNMYDEMEEAV